MSSGIRDDLAILVHVALGAHDAKGVRRHGLHRGRGPPSALRPLGRQQHLVLQVPFRCHVGVGQPWRAAFERWKSSFLMPLSPLSLCESLRSRQHDVAEPGIVGADELILCDHRLGQNANELLKSLKVTQSHSTLSFLSI